MAGASLTQQLQGNVAPGFNKAYAAFVLVSFPGRDAGRRWLNAVAAEIATADQVSAFKVAYKASASLTVGHGSSPLTARWTNLAFSWRGLERLASAADIAAFPSVFKTNRMPYAALRPEDDQVHALLILAADDQADLDADLVRHRKLRSSAGADEVRTYDGQALPGGYEHFGFKDLAAQPRVDGIDSPDPTRAPTVPPGAFVVGASLGNGYAPLPGPPWTRYGSYLAFVQLEQHVGLFRESMAREATRLGISADSLAASLVGRNQDGTEVSNPAPPFSHIGRSHPSRLPLSEANRYLLLRRGIPYGDPLPAGASDEGGRGLLFVAYQADLQSQFERVWGHWLNNPNLPAPGSGPDALVGQRTPGAGRRTVTATRPGTYPSPVRLRLPQFVTPQYGGYFFAPSIAGINPRAGQPHASPRANLRGGNW